MIVEGLTFGEVREKYPQLKNNRFNILDDYEADFPQLVEKAESTNINKNRIVMKALKPTTAYRTVIKRAVKDTNEKENRFNQLYKETIQREEDNRMGIFQNIYCTSPLEREIKRLTERVKGNLAGKLDIESFKTTLKEVKIVLDRIIIEQDLGQIREGLNKSPEKERAKETTVKKVTSRKVSKQ